MTSRKQKHEAMLAKREHAIAEERAVGLAALQAEEKRRADRLARQQIEDARVYRKRQGITDAVNRIVSAGAHD